MQYVAAFAESFWFLPTGVAHAANSNAFKKLASTIVTMAEEEGLRGFYAGMLPNILQVLPNAALSYYAYETFKQLLKVPD